MVTIDAWLALRSFHARIRGNAQYLAETACANGVPSLFLPDAEAAGRWLKENLRPGDAVLLKGSRGVHLERALAVLQSSEPGTQPVGEAH